MSAKVKIWPVYERHVIIEDAHKSGFRPDMREVAKNLAKYILENGLIVEHGPEFVENMDARQYCFAIYTLKRQETLP